MKKSTMEAFAEVDTILGYMDKIYIDKLPEQLVKTFKEKKAHDYVKNINPNEPLEKQDLKEETLAILAVLNYDYWCIDKKQKEKLMQKYKDNERKHQEELRKLYDPDRIFENRQKNMKIMEEHKELNKKREDTSKKMLGKIKKIIPPDLKTVKVDLKNIIEVVDENGNIKKFLGLLYFTLNSDKNEYIVFTDYENADFNKIYALKVVKKENQIVLENITNRSSIDEIKEIIKGLKFEKFET